MKKTATKTPTIHKVDLTLTIDSMLAAGEPHRSEGAVALQMLVESLVASARTLDAALWTAIDESERHKDGVGEYIKVPRAMLAPALDALSVSINAVVSADYLCREYIKDMSR